MWLFIRRFVCLPPALWVITPLLGREDRCLRPVASLWLTVWVPEKARHQKGIITRLGHACPMLSRGKWEPERWRWSPEKMCVLESMRPGSQPNSPFLSSLGQVTSILSLSLPRTSELPEASLLTEGKTELPVCTWLVPNTKQNKYAPGDSNRTQSLNNVSFKNVQTAT